MAIALQAYISIEKSLTKKLKWSLAMVSADIRRQVMTAIANGKWQEAERIANEIDLSPVFYKNLSFINYSSYAALLFGATRLTKNVRNTTILAKDHSKDVKRATTLLRKAITQNVAKAMTKALLREISIAYNEANIQKGDYEGHPFRGNQYTRGEGNLGGLGIPRSEMPQIKSSDMPEFIEYAKGKGVSVTTSKAKVSDLKPSQKEVNPDQVAQMPEGALRKPITVSNDNYVLDGHNRWARLLQLDGNNVIDTVELGLKAKEALALMHSFPKSFSKRVEDVGATKKEAISSSDLDLAGRKTIESGIKYRKKRKPLSIIGVEKAGERLAQPFVSFSKSGDSMLQLVSQLHTSRLSAFGFTAEADVLGIEEYQITEQLDNRICPVCEEMHGKTFRVADARETLETVLDTNDPAELEQLQPWPDQSPSGIEELAGMSADEIIERNWHIPPYHPGCRGLLVAVGDAKDAPTDPEEVTTEDEKVTSTVESTVGQLGTGFAVVSSKVTMNQFRKAGIKATADDIKVWNDVLDISIDDALAGALTLDDLAMLADAGISSALLTSLSAYVED